MYTSLKINEEGAFSITRPFESRQILEIITKTVMGIGPIGKLIITDATACVGGDLINFCNAFKYVNGVEISKDNYNILKTNVKICKCYNSNLFNQDYWDIYDQLRQDIIYIDPPWGGVEYKNKESISLELSGKPLKDLILLIKIKRLARYVFVKAPLNVDDSLEGNVDIIYNKNNVETFKLIAINAQNF